MRFIIATPNPYTLKLFSKVFRNTQGAHGDMWVTMMVDACDPQIRRKFPEGTVWVTPNPRPFLNPREIAVTSPCISDTHVFDAFQHALRSLNYMQDTRVMDWVVITPFGSPSDSTVHDMHAAYTQLHKPRLPMFVDIATRNGHPGDQ